MRCAVSAKWYGLLLLLACALSPCHASEQSIWLGPLQPNDIGIATGYKDYFEALSSSARWPSVAGRTAVFQLYFDLLNRSTGEKLSAVSQFQTRTKIPLAIEIPNYWNSAACAAEPPPAHFRSALRRAKDAGIEIDYASIVGVLVDGRVGTAAHACHAGLGDLATHFTEISAVISSVWPNARIGETEPVGYPNTHQIWTEYSAWLDALREHDQKISFLHLDVGWPHDWVPDVQFVRKLALSQGIPFGVVLNTDGTELSSHAAAVATLKHATEVRDRISPLPDHAIFQSWFQYPDRALPESDPDSLFGLVYSYLKPGSRIVKAGTGKLQLLGASGSGIGSAKISISSKPDSVQSSQMTELLGGIVPRGAMKALVALRIHAECDCPDTAESELYLSDLQFKETGAAGSAGTTIRRSSFLPGSLPSAFTSCGDLGSGCTQVHVSGTTPFLRNGQSFPVTEGAPFGLSGILFSQNRHANFGVICLVFQNQDSKEVRRGCRPLDTPYQGEVALITQSDGVVSLNALGVGSTRVRANFAGNDTFAPSSAELVFP